MIEVAAHIQRLACAGVSIMLDNLRLNGGSNSVLPPGWETHGLAQPSWIEGYRVPVPTSILRSSSPHIFGACEAKRFASIVLVRVELERI